MLSCLILSCSWESSGSLVPMVLRPKLNDQMAKGQSMCMLMCEHVSINQYLVNNNYYIEAELKCEVLDLYLKKNNNNNSW